MPFLCAVAYTSIGLQVSPFTGHAIYASIHVTAQRMQSRTRLQGWRKEAPRKVREKGAAKKVREEDMPAASPAGMHRMSGCCSGVPCARACACSLQELLHQCSANQPAADGCRGGVPCACARLRPSLRLFTAGTAP